MASSATTFARLPELLRCLVDQIRNRKQLATLRLVSKNFSAAVEPTLFRKISAMTPRRVMALADNHLVGHIRNLALSNLCPEFKFLDEAVPGLLMKMPLLNAFSYLSYLEPASLRALHRSCLHIKSLSFNFCLVDASIHGKAGKHPVEIDVQARGLYRMPDFTTFTRLEELTLVNLYDDLRQWREPIARVLSNSHTLRKLHLSLSRNAIARHRHAGNTDQYTGWFDSLCDDYADTEASPLPLQSLHCGTAVYLEDVERLERLVDLGRLEDVHFQNNVILAGGTLGHGIDIDDSAVVYDAFLNAPRLRSFTVAVLRPRDLDAICDLEDPSKARKIAFVYDLSHVDLGPVNLWQPDDSYPKLPIHFKMLKLALGQQINGSSVIHDNTETPDPGLLDETQLTSLVSRDDGVLEGLVVALPNEKYPRYSDSDRAIHLLERLLPRLTRLTQLCVIQEETTNNQFDQHRRLAIASRLASAIPSLGYISVRDLMSKDEVWEVIHEKDGMARLEELNSFGDHEDVELFSLVAVQRRFSNLRLDL
ncbi:hypothetical protein QBC34DRAFT_378384 [Podospora aff. communis PSN243]|uniref:F-box domain-containing protein n=1 Tax=Podospora aff. communis PSN243 TaxID=3040156 RepID=A0AAV9GTD7_9PEZI|nr:hypothetical protein QBC34DRAFT_378384 [Podospora aff. communis PSN243]